jgi:hypothetical protein
MFDILNVSLLFDKNRAAPFRCYQHQNGASEPTCTTREIPLFNLLMTPSRRHTLRGLLGTVSDAIRSVTAPAALVADKAEAPAAVEAPEPAGLYEPDEMPDTATIERAALSLDLANDNARRADRAKRAARKVLDRLPAGTYGTWIVERVTSNRQTADLDAIREMYKRHNLGAVPMKANAPSLKVRRAELVPADITAVAAELATA